uniref:Transmembrane protein n=1 Tax=Monodon monoceros TaxID=40151 RepID=A0A8C6B7H8_MONMO
MQKACGARRRLVLETSFHSLPQDRRMGLGDTFWFSGFVLLWFGRFCISYFSFFFFFFSFFFSFLPFLSCHSPSQKPPSTLLI